MRIEDWFLTEGERGNPHTRIDARHPGGHAWSSGNRADPLVHGATYYGDLHARIQAMGPGDLVFFVDWRGDPDERLTGEPGSEVSAVLEDAARRGVDVRGLVWRSHWDRLGYSSTEADHLGEEIEEAGGECLRDMRVLSGGSHHQKFVVLRHGDDPTRDVAYVGGIDLCHSRRDDERHLGDPQPVSMSSAFGDTPAWHDVQVALRGPVVHDVETAFRERWEDSNPLTRHPVQRLQSFLSREDQTPDPLPRQAPPPPPVPSGDGGTHHVQILRTYPRLRHGYDFAPQGEYSVARGYAKALTRARRIIYVEDQYLWSAPIAQTFVDALRREPDLRIVCVLPRLPTQTGPIATPPSLVGRREAMAAMRAAGGDRVAFYGLENEAGLPIYVHAKVCVVDDRWASIGSDNFNRRSWTHDTELTAVVWDDEPVPGPASDGHPPARYARDLRLRLSREHLGVPEGEDRPDLEDPHVMAGAMAACALDLDEWHDGGRLGPRPPGRLRTLSVPTVAAWQRPWATLLYRHVFDPDGRPRGRRGSTEF